MPIVNTDIQVRLSGGAVNSSPLTSIGGVKSSAQAGTDIFAGVTSAEATAGSTKYRCVYLHNAHATLSAQALVVWINANTPSPTTTVSIGVGAAAVNATETAVGAETTAPAGVVFTASTTEATALALSTLPAGQHRALWLRRVVDASTAALASDSVSLGFRFDTL